MKAAKAFFKELDEMSTNAYPKKGKKGNPVKAQQAYLKGLEVLDTYLDLVELPPTESGEYEKTFDTKVGRNARIT